MKNPTPPAANPADYSAREIVEDLTAALAEFEAIASALETPLAQHFSAPTTVKRALNAD